MPVAIYRDSGDTIKYTPSGADVEVGEVVVVGEVIGIAHSKILDGVEGNLNVKGGYDMDATAAETYTKGQYLYFDNTTKKTTGTKGSNKFAGIAGEAKAAAVATSRVLVSPQHDTDTDT